MTPGEKYTFQFRTRALQAFLQANPLKLFSSTVLASRNSSLAETKKCQPTRRQQRSTLCMRLPAFEHAGPDVAQRFVQRDQILDRTNWYRDKTYDALAQELIELHVGLQVALSSKDNPSAAHGNDRRVEHLGHGVYVQYNKLAIDRDAQEGNPVTITREESRSVVHHALDALKERYNVCVTGQSGIGKTRGSMMYALQCLLHRKAPVLYVGYKSEMMLLFLPGDDGRYRVWTKPTVGKNPGETLLKFDSRVVMVIDPPEDELYSSAGMCRVLKNVSNDEEKHFRNWWKDGVLLTTSMPSKEEVVAMTKVLWDERRSPHEWQRGKCNTRKDKMAEVEKRIDLVGAIPRLVFDSSSFKAAIQQSLMGAKEAAALLSDSDLYRALCGSYTPLPGKHPASTSSRLLAMGAEIVHHRDWKERRDHLPTSKLTPIAALLLQHRLEKYIEVLRTKKFENFAFDWTCVTYGRRAEVQSRAEGMQDQAFRRIASLRSSEGVVYRPAAGNFSGIDFAIDALEWYNARSKLITLGNKTEIGEGGIRKFLSKLEEVMRKNMSGSEIEALLASGSPVLTMLTNRELEPRWKESAESYKLFDKEVLLKAINLQDFSAVSEMLHTSRTEQILQELQELRD